ncbi:hypothetical protein HPB47_022672 [Ixodes persulcatus]|uniref:Uncharacterized protein n=1 Tax=Ixodes persulcatus TaxID=34615 RepID=A0AC60QA63_IXOPE|nr:hypothetical protein HPB47_022672 [Ixodes persulcatus]
MTLASVKEREHCLDYGSHSLMSESKAVKALDGPFLRRMDGMAYMTQKNMGWQNLAPEGVPTRASTQMTHAMQPTPHPIGTCMSKELIRRFFACGIAFQASIEFNPQDPCK